MMCEAGVVYNYLTCTCRNMTPIIISLSKNGIRLTDVGGGVRFDLNGDGSAEHIAWTAAGTDDGFLVLDRNHNGVIDDGRELFSDIAPQPTSQYPNGFLALAEYDKGEFGGNANGFIDAGDTIFTDLRIWVDRNHNGVTEPGELLRLSDVGVSDISLSATRRPVPWVIRWVSRGKSGSRRCPLFLEAGQLRFCPQQL